MAQCTAPPTVTAHRPRLPTARCAVGDRGTAPLTPLRRLIVIWRRAGIYIRVAIVWRLDHLATHPIGQIRLVQPGEWRAVEPYVEKAAEQARTHPERRDPFLCHAWDDRQGSAAELHRHLRRTGRLCGSARRTFPSAR